MIHYSRRASRKSSHKDTEQYLRLDNVDAFSTTDALHMGREHASREKKISMVNFLLFVQKNVSRIRFQEIKIRPFQDFEKKAFFSLFLMRKRLSSGQKWFLRPYFPLIRGMFLLKSGL